MNFRWLGKSDDGNTVTLQRLNECPLKSPDYYTQDWIQKNSDVIRCGVALDVETTGLQRQSCHIIEIALREFFFNKSNGDVLSLGRSYESFQEPPTQIPDEIIQLTGITPEMVAGKNIDWNTVDTIIGDAHLVIAHNASFDRPFIDRHSKPSVEKVWACSHRQVDWKRHGFSSTKLELLNIYHGFFTDSHRAMNDVDALLYLLSLSGPFDRKSYLSELIENARRPSSQVVASGAPFDSKDFLKQRGYSWDNTNRFWSKVIFKDQVSDEISWLESSVYFGSFRGFTRDFALTDSFKAQN